mmetsp:Transcript_5928/g.6840  ORF Transcript_5928/g.6840 Transcript_5928/m.6840 type:complete len:139 (+) Transcript_5928:312-728(+)
MVATEGTIYSGPSKIYIWGFIKTIEVVCQYGQLSVQLFFDLAEGGIWHLNFVDALTHELYKLVGFSYVDDTDLVVNGEKTFEVAKDLQDYFEQSLLSTPDYLSTTFKHYNIVSAIMGIWRDICHVVHSLCMSRATKMR